MEASMNELALVNDVKTMSSIEIAELTGKRHDNVMRDARTMLTQLYDEWGVLDFEGTYTNAQNGQQYQCFNLPKEETLCLVAGYNVKVRMAIIKRWQELEEQASKPKLPANYLEALQALTVEVEQRMLLEAKVAEQQPKVEFYDAVASSSGSFDFGEAAKTMKLGFGSHTLFKKLREHGYLMHNNEPYQRYVDAGYFVVVERKWIHPNSGETMVATQTRMTNRGMDYFLTKLNDEVVT